MRGSVLVGGVGRPTQRLDGSAALVWMVLDSPATLPEVRERIHLTWPDLSEGNDAENASTLMADTLTLLLAEDLISPVGRDTRSRPGPAGP